MEQSSKSVTDQDFIIIGQIGKPHGVKGDIRIYPLTDFPDRFASLRMAYIDNTPIEINTVHPANDFMIMNIKNINSREKAAALTGKLLKVRREEAAPLSSGEYYAFDIIGLEVYDEDNKCLGVITDILKTGSNDVYVVSDQITAKNTLIPALKKIVIKIDIEHKRMDVILPPED